MADVGRPTLYDKKLCRQAYKLCLLGYTIDELADFFNVAASTIHLWLTKHPEFSESVKKGRESADCEVVTSLYKRAKGYRYTEKVRERLPVKQKISESIAENEAGSETTEEIESKNYEIVEKMQLTKTTTKEIPPDVAACVVWLKNRQPKKWRDNKDVNLNVKGKLEDFINE